MSGPESVSETDASDPSASPHQAPRFQFSLAWLLIAVTVVAVLLGVGQWFSPTVLAYVGSLLLSAVLGCILPTPFVVAALFARGDVRAFSIGALVPWIVNRGVLPMSAMYGYSSSLSGWVWIVGIIGYMLLTAAVCGVVAVVGYRMIRRYGYGP